MAAAIYVVKRGTFEEFGCISFRRKGFEEMMSTLVFVRMKSNVNAYIYVSYAFIIP